MNVVSTSKDKICKIIFVLNQLYIYKSPPKLESLQPAKLQDIFLLNGNLFLQLYIKAITNKRLLCELPFHKFFFKFKEPNITVYVSAFKIFGLSYTVEVLRCSPENIFWSPKHLS